MHSPELKLHSVQTARFDGAFVPTSQFFSQVASVGPAGQFTPMREGHAGEYHYSVERDLAGAGRTVWRWTVSRDDSHVALNTIIGPDGVQRQILRGNMAFGTVGRREFGTYFIGYASTPTVIEQMLENMFIGDPPGNSDRILDFSNAVTGSLFFVPTGDFLDDPPPAADAGTDPTGSADEPSAAPSGGSLEIGGLKDGS